MPGGRTDNEPWAGKFLAHPVPFKPGTHFLYNTLGTYMLSAIVQKATGMTVLDYLTPRLFEPLGIEHPTWGTSPGISGGAYGLVAPRISPLRPALPAKGNLEGEASSRAWVKPPPHCKPATAAIRKAIGTRGMVTSFGHAGTIAFAATGPTGNSAWSCPKQDAVIAITSGVPDICKHR